MGKNSQTKLDLLDLCLVPYVSLHLFHEINKTDKVTSKTYYNWNILL